MLYRTVDPFISSRREMERLRRRMDRLFDEPQPRLFAAPAYPAMNVWTHPDGVVVTAELPGVKAEDLDISVLKDTLTLSGSRTADTPEGEYTYHRRERGYGRFTRSLQLPFQVEPGKVEAALENGLLTITLPRAEADKPKRIKVG